MQFVAGYEQAQRSDFATAAVKLLSRIASLESDSIERDCKHRNIEKSQRLKHNHALRAFCS